MFFFFFFQLISSSDLTINFSRSLGPLISLQEIGNKREQCYSVQLSSCFFFTRVYLVSVCLYLSMYICVHAYSYIKERERYPFISFIFVFLSPQRTVSHTHTNTCLSARAFSVTKLSHSASMATLSPSPLLKSQTVNKRSTCKIPYPAGCQLPSFGEFQGLNALHSTSDQLPVCRR